METAKKRILVAGGAGFIGQNLCTKLLDDGHFVICLDNFSTGERDYISLLTNRPNFELIEHDIIEPIFLQVDEIYNLACPASPKKYQMNPIRTTLTNVQGSINMLDLARRSGAKILQGSTSEVYGDPEIHPQQESYFGNVNPIGVRACYDEGKRCAESLFFDYMRTYNVRIKVARIFNTYGPGMSIDDGRVVSNFIVNALGDEDLILYGDGSQTRSFLYIDDLVDGLIKLMSSAEEISGPINLGNPIETSIHELAITILTLINSTSSLKFGKLPDDDPKRRRPNIDLAKSHLNWNPETPLELGLQRTISYFQSRSN